MDFVSASPWLDKHYGCLLTKCKLKHIKSMKRIKKFRIDNVVTAKYLKAYQKSFLFDV